MTLALLALLACMGGPNDDGGNEGVDPTHDDGKRRGKKKKNVKKGTGGPAESFSAVFGTDPCESPAKPGKGTLSFSFGGESYEVISSVPKSSGKRDLVLLLHGGRGKPATILKQTDFAEMVDEIDAIVLAPQAATPDGSPGPKWNNGKYIPSDGVDFPRDDIAFLEALVSEAKAKACVDDVLVVGFSGGSVMANRWMCEGKNPPDGIVTAAGTLPNSGSKCKNRGGAVRGYIGSADDRYRTPVIEGRGMNAVETLEFWARKNNCKGVAETKTGDTTCRNWKNCDAPTTLCVVQGYGHEFPRGRRGRPPTGQDASEAGWEWFDGEVK